MDSSRVVSALSSPRGSVAVAEGDVGAVIRTARKALGLTQAGLSTRTGYSQPTISRAEQGQVHDRDTLTDLADALAIPRAALGLDRSPVLSGPRLDDMDRRDVLRGVLAVASAAMLPAAIVNKDRRIRIGKGDVAQCKSALDRLYELDYIQGGRPVYELSASMARRLQDTLGRGNYSPSVGRELRAVTAATCENAGWQAYDAGRYDDAHGWWLETRHIANLGEGAGEAQVIALASMSLEASEHSHRGRDAVDLARTAAKAAGSSGTPTLRSLLAAREAMGHALLGDTKASAAAFGRAHRHLDASGQAEDPAWLSFYGPSDLAWHEMTAAQLSRQPKAAEHAANDAISYTDVATMPRNHAIYSASLGHILAAAGRYDEAIAVSRSVLQNPALAGSVRPVTKLQATAKLLAKTSYPAARNFAATVGKLASA
ncbi:MAG: hypothetical protein QOG10_6862 [Kribbellaceae bacterium]|nr:hypothetical protein [Kribbellaceae bacterium]